MSGNSTLSVIIAIAVGLMVICIVPLVTLEENDKFILPLKIHRKKLENILKITKTLSLE